MAKKKDIYEEFAGEFKNEALLEEELEAEDLNPKKVEEEHFGEEETPAIEDREIIAIKKKKKR